jgi:hypothetical protein
MDMRGSLEKIAAAFTIFQKHLFVFTGSYGGIALEAIVAFR